MTCPTCHGKGIIKCERCGGTGQIVSMLSNVKCVVSAEDPARLNAPIVVVRAK